jgi:hypothetical protein
LDKFLDNQLGDQDLQLNKESEEDLQEMFRRSKLFDPIQLLKQSLFQDNLS